MTNGVKSFPVLTVFVGLSMRGIMKLSEPGEVNLPNGIDRLKNGKQKGDVKMMNKGKNKRIVRSRETGPAAREEVIKNEKD